MKTTLIIETDNRVSFDKIIDSVRKIKGVKKVESTGEVEEEIASPFPSMLQEELDERIQKSVTGPTASSETVAKYFAKWEDIK